MSVRNVVWQLELKGQQEDENEKKKIYIAGMVMAITLAACGNTSKDVQNDTSGSVDEKNSYK